MANESPNWRALFGSTLRILHGQGYELAPEDYVELGLICRDATSPDRCASSFVYPPVFVGNVVLFFPAIYALKWWEDYGRIWYGADDTLATIAVAYICAANKSKEKIDLLWNKNEADKALLSFRLSLGITCTTKELEAALQILMPDDEKEETESEEWRASSSGYGGLIARLCALTKKTPDDFIMLPANQCVELLHTGPSELGGIDDRHIDAVAKREFDERIKRLKKRLKCSA